MSEEKKNPPRAQIFRYFRIESRNIKTDEPWLWKTKTHHESNRIEHDLNRVNKVKQGRIMTGTDSIERCTGSNQWSNSSNHGSIRFE